MDNRPTHPTREREVLERIEARRRRPVRRLAEEHVTLAHGAGGRSSRALVEALFIPALGNELLAPLGDSAILESAAGRLAFTTDAYVVKPLVFPGGDIGELAINGTVNDLAVAGAQPLYLSAAFVVEEGFPVADLRSVAESMGAAARAAGVRVAAGDTKVVERGGADRLFVTTAGIGTLPAGLELSAVAIRAGDRVLISGTIADHGMAIMVARGELELEGDIASDTAPVHDLVAALLAAAPGAVRCLRDPTRGGLATTLNELAVGAGLSIALDEAAVPVAPAVRGACEILGIDPLYVANEGKLVAIVAPDAADTALSALRAHPLGARAAIVGEVRADPPGMVVLETAFGGSRVVDMLAGDPLPRIC
jgi:hydrogenase expression/formation protein HypE